MDNKILKTGLPLLLLAAPLQATPVLSHLSGRVGGRVANITQPMNPSNSSVEWGSDFASFSKTSELKKRSEEVDQSQVLSFLKQNNLLGAGQEITTSTSGNLDSQRYTNTNALYCNPPWSISGCSSGGDVTAPIYDNSTPTVSSITTTGFQLAVDINEGGRIFYVVVADNATAPSATQVRNGQNNSGASALKSGNATVNSGNFSTTFTITGLTAGTNYDVYVVSQDDEATPNIGSVIKRDITTAAAAPTVSSVTASTANGAYNAGDLISIQVNFSANVTVTGTPQLTIETGSTDRVINYASGSGTSTLNFSYTVQAGDTSNDLDYLSANALVLNGGSIKSISAVDAVLTLATPGAANSLGANKALVIDTTAPTITSASNKATLKAGETAALTFSLSEASNTFTDADISVTGGSLSGFSGSGTSYTATFTPSANSTTQANINVPAGGFSDVAGNTNTAATQLPIQVNTVIPNVNSINRVSSALTNATTVSYTASFTDSVSGVDVTDFMLTGSATGTISNVTAVDASTYTVTVNNISGNGTLRLDLKNSGTGIVNTAGNSIASGYTSGQAYTFDFAPPGVTSVSVPASATYIAGAALNFTVNFNEAVTVNTTGGTPRIAITLGSSTVYATYISGSGSSALTFRYTVQTDNLDTNGIVLSAAIDTNGGTITDDVGNNAITALNSVGNTSSVLVDAVAPAAPSVPDLTSASDTGASNTDNITGVQTPTFTGTAEVGSTVSLYLSDRSSLLGSAVVDGSGNWVITSSSLSFASHTVTARAVDSAGNLSTFSPELTVDINLALVPLEVTTNLDSGVDLTTAGSISADIADGGGLSLREALSYVADNGTISFSAGLNNQTINLSSAATVKSGVIFDSSSLGNLAISGSQLNPSGSWAVTNGAGSVLTIASVVTGTYGLTKNGAGTLTLSGSNTYSGTTTIAQGTLSISSDANLGVGSLNMSAGTVLSLTGAGTIDNSINLTGAASIQASANVTLSGALSGSSTLTKTGASTLKLQNTTNSTSMTGGVTVAAGTLSIDQKTSLPSGTLTLDSGTLAPTSSVTLDNNIVLGSGGGTISGSWQIDLRGLISGTGALTKTSTSNLFMYGNNTFSGGVINSSGLIAAFNYPTAMGTGTVVLAESTSLGFASVGTANFSNNIVLNGSASLVVGNTGNDNVTINGIVSESGGSRNLTLNAGS